MKRFVETLYRRIVQVGEVEIQECNTGKVKPQVSLYPKFNLSPAPLAGLISCPHYLRKAFVLLKRMTETT